MIAGCSPAEADAPVTTEAAQASELTEAMQNIGEQMLEAVDDRRIAELSEDEFVRISLDLSARMEEQRDRYEADEQQYKDAQELIDLLGAAYFGDQANEDDIFEASRDEMAVMLGEPTKYNQTESVWDLAKAYEEAWEANNP